MTAPALPPLPKSRIWLPLIWKLTAALAVAFIAIAALALGWINTIREAHTADCLNSVLAQRNQPLLQELYASRHFARSVKTFGDVAFDPHASRSLKMAAAATFQPASAEWSRALDTTIHAVQAHPLGHC